MASEDRTFGEYTLKERLGIGGMATVYRAIHHQLDQEVAIKILHEHFIDNPVANKRLEREASIAQTLQHPNIVPILAFGEVEGRPYLTMPYYSGGTLADYFQEPRHMKAERTLDILKILSGALDYAHSRGVIHRDFKLENILLDDEREPAVSDFGIAQVANTTRLTISGHFLGTPQYMAPEQSSNVYGQVDFRSDLYAFGVMAYLLLTGVFPFTAEEPLQLMLKHHTKTALAPSSINTRLNANVDAVLLKAIAKEPDDRYQSATNFVLGLNRAFTNFDEMTTLIDVARPNPADDTDADIIEPATVLSELADRNALQAADTDAYTTSIPAIVPNEPIQREVTALERLLARPISISIAIALFIVITMAGFALIDEVFWEGTQERPAEQLAPPRPTQCTTPIAQLTPIPTPERDTTPPTECPPTVSPDLDNQASSPIP